jgi:4-hydroxyproline epimerase
MSEARLPGQLKIVDSHTAGEPTRCVLDGFPDPGAGSLAERLEHLRSRHDHLRRAILCEPRGSDVLVGAYLVQPVNPTSATGVIFFNNAGYLGMCGHGTIGVAVTLAHLGRIQPGEHALDTPVGTVAFVLHPGNRVSIRNVPAYRYRTAVAVDVPGFGPIAGDIAWGGNWFFLSEAHPVPLTLEHRDQLTDYTWAIRQGLASANITGANSAEIDHIELSSPPHDPANSSRNFVLCPGKAYDRSPCGTGTSAKLACLAADGKLQPGQPWRQEGILGTIFEGSFKLAAPEHGHNPSHGPKIIPTITGSAYITGESTLIFDPADPFRMGVPE